MEIPYSELSDDALLAIIEEFVSREGTEYGAQEYSMAQKIEQVKAQLKLGEVILNYDADSQSCDLQAKPS